jgi:hypothetical protein
MAPSVLDLSRAGDSGELAGAISAIAAQPVMVSGRLATAVRAADGSLKLISWRVSASGTVSRIGDSGTQAGAATSIDIAVGGKTVTACRASSGDLKLISWDVPANGAPTRRGDSGSQAGEATRIRIVALSAELFVTACRAADGDMRLISWRVAADGAITRLRDSGDAAGEVTEIAMAVHQSTGGGGRVVTAVRDADGDLKVIVWSVSADGAISRIGDGGAGGAGNATLIRVVRDAHANIVTAVRDGDGDLKLITWRIGQDGLVTRLADSGDAAGAIADNALTALGDGVVSAVRTSAGGLKLIAWSTAANGTIRRLSDSADQAGAATLIDIVAGDNTTGVSAVTAVRAANGALKLITWRPTCVRLHVKVLTQPDVSIDTALESMRQVYATVGIAVRHISTETLDLPALNDIDVGSCTRGNTTDDQDELVGNRNSVRAGDIVVYFVRSTVPPSNGCAAHPDARPGVVVARGATRWTLGHEVGHVLGLNHLTETDRLMTGGGTANITNPPPDLAASEASTMQDSPLTNECAGS